MDILNKLLPAKIQAFLPLLHEILKDQSVVDDLVIALTEVEKEISKVSNNPAIDKGLKEAFNDAALVASAGKTYIKDRKIPMMAGAKLVASKGRITDNMRTLGAAFKARQPACVAFSESLKQNAAFSSSVKRLVEKKNGELFRLEDGENGQGYAVELITGNSVKILLEKNDYEEIKKTFIDKKDSPAPKPKQPPGPGL
ncbi:MAG: hypothetical protein HY052_09515 [Proteobacteria bacterium]|nr:hypothetical protein [Pseudomonadota bacterium]